MRSTLTQLNQAGNYNNKSRHIHIAIGIYLSIYMYDILIKQSTSIEFHDDVGHATRAKQFYNFAVYRIKMS